MKKKERILILNWKSNPHTLADAVALADETARISSGAVSLFVAPPFPYLDAVGKSFAKAISPISLGAQDIMPFAGSSITGGISGYMLQDAGVSFVLVGHSERRYVLGESDALINEKFLTALKMSIVPIVCVGEREKTGESQAIQESLDQLSLAIDGAVSERFMVAYEPVWAIGGNKDVVPDYAAGVISGIKKYLDTVGSADSIPVLYGGSVRCENISSLLHFNEIDGFLVGSASLSYDAVSCLIEKINAS